MTRSNPAPIFDTVRLEGRTLLLNPARIALAQVVPDDRFRVVLEVWFAAADGPHRTFRGADAVLVWHALGGTAEDFPECPVPE